MIADCCNTRSAKYDLLLLNSGFHERPNHRTKIAVDDQPCSTTAILWNLGGKTPVVKTLRTRRPWVAHCPAKGPRRLLRDEGTLKMSANQDTPMTIQIQCRSSDLNHAQSQSRFACMHRIKVPAKQTLGATCRFLSRGRQLTVGV
jgi:hypothetical protein